MTALVPSRHSIEWRPPLPAYPVASLAPRTPHRNAHNWRPGLGSDTSTGISLATSGTILGSTLAGATAIASIAGPIGTIAGLLAGLLTQIFSGCGQSCTLTSDAANQVEQLLQQNMAAYFASSRTASENAAALANFDNTWAKLEQYCGNPSFGAPGQRCVTDREQGSCAYQTSPGSWNGCTWQGGGANGSGTTCWNWFVGYRDPIANDPCIVPDAAVATTTSGETPGQVTSSVASAWSTTDFAPLLLVAGLILVAVIL